MVEDFFGPTLWPSRPPSRRKRLTSNTIDHVFIMELSRNGRSLCTGGRDLFGDEHYT